jgi:hypothetical protein
LQLTSDEALVRHDLHLPFTILTLELPHNLQGAKPPKQVASKQSNPTISKWGTSGSLATATDTPQYMSSHHYHVPAPTLSEFAAGLNVPANSITSDPGKYSEPTIGWQSGSGKTFVDCGNLRERCIEKKPDRKTAEMDLLLECFGKYGATASGVDLFDTMDPRELVLLIKPRVAGTQLTLGHCAD